MSYVASVLLVTPVEHRAAAALILASVTDNPYDAYPDSFSLPLIGLGASGEPTHYAAHIRVKAQNLLALPSLAHLVPGSSWGVTEHDDDTEPRPSASEYLAAVGLQIVEDQEIE
jgi:hypothetical protein